MIARACAGRRPTEATVCAHALGREPRSLPAAVSDQLRQPDGSEVCARQSSACCATRRHLAIGQCNCSRRAEFGAVMLACHLRTADTARGTARSALPTADQLDSNLSAHRHVVTAARSSAPATGAPTPARTVVCARASTSPAHTQTSATADRAPRANSAKPSSVAASQRANTVGSAMKRRRLASVPSGMVVPAVDVSPPCPPSRVPAR